MRKRGCVDDNQGDIVKALRKIPGVTVVVLSAVGNGCPDIAVGYQLRNYFLEIKDPTKPKNKQALTEAQQVWHLEWKGQVRKVTSLEQALEVIGVKLAA